jgi:hypothetical protein
VPSLNHAFVSCVALRATFVCVQLNVALVRGCREAAQKLNIKEHMVYPHPLSGIPPQRLATAADVEGHHIVGPAPSSPPPLRGMVTHPCTCVRVCVCACACACVRVRVCVCDYKNGQFYLVDLSRVFPPEAPNARCAPPPKISRALPPSVGPKMSNSDRGSLFIAPHRPIAAAREWATSIASSGQVLSLPPPATSAQGELTPASNSRAGEAFPNPALQRRVQVRLFILGRKALVGWVVPSRPIGRT